MRYIGTYITRKDDVQISVTEVSCGEAASPEEAYAKAMAGAMKSLEEKGAEDIKAEENLITYALSGQNLATQVLVYDEEQTLYEFKSQEQSTVTMYMGALYQAEISRKELRKLLKKTPEDEWEQALRDYAISRDMSPQLFPESRDASAAEAEFEQMLKIDLEYPLCYITCTALEEYQADADGAFIDGSNYDYEMLLDEEMKEKLTEFLS